MKNKSLFTTKNLCLTALFTAIVCIATFIIQIPISLGYAHLGDCMILLSTHLLGAVGGMISGGIGSALADIISGFPIWALPTLIIKSIMPLVAYPFLRKNKIYFTIIGAVLSLLFMTLGYVVAGSIIYGSIELGITQTPGLLLKSAVNLVAFILLYKLPFKKYLKF